MLTKPIDGWSVFQLEGISSYELSFLDDIAFEWVEQAIHGLETMLPFCVKGFLETDRVLCTVSYWNCHVICEWDGRNPLNKDTIVNEVSHTNMLQFCRYLYDDISQNFNEWISFIGYEDMDIAKRKKVLVKKLARLKELIDKREKMFDGQGGFL